jgi:hypothetical protein
VHFQLKSALTEFKTFSLFLSSVTFNMPTDNIFVLLIFLNYIIFKDEVVNKSQNGRNQGFFLLVCLTIA